MADKYVFRAEYALSDRSACKQCDRNIGKDQVRLAILTQSRFHDGMDTNWCHPACFFKRKPGTQVDEIWHFHDLRWSDQERIREMAENAGKAKSSAKKSSKKQKKQVEVEEESEESDEDVVDDKKKRPSKLATDGGPSKKVKSGDSALRAQNERLWQCRDLVADMPKKARELLLSENNQHVPIVSKQLDRIVDMLVFGPTARCGVCSSDSGHIVISADAYRCIGSVSAWAKCDYKTQNPKRGKLVVPEELLKKHDYLTQFAKSPAAQRLFPACYGVLEGGSKVNGVEKDADVVDGPSTSNGHASKTNGITVKKFNSKKPLNGLKIGAAGTLSVKRQEMIAIITKLGGVHVSKCSKDTFVVISDEKSITSRPVFLEMAEVCGVHVVPVDFLDICQTGSIKSQDELFGKIDEIHINPWKTTDLSSRLAKNTEALPSGLSSTEMHRRMEAIKGSAYELDHDERLKVLVKNGGAVDPDSDLDPQTHSVYKNDDMVYSCVLAKVDTVSGGNSYYKLQIVQHDRKAEYYFVRSWGRIGTTRGGNTCEELELDEAIEKFEYHFLEKSGNEWTNREKFVKKPHKYFIMELDFGPVESEQEYRVAPGSKTKLAPPVQDLLKIIFDVEEMKRTMKEFEIDLRKMPLGKLSRTQITQAMRVLSELQTTIESGHSSQPRLVDGSNRFFTLIPHDFGMKAPPLLNQLVLVKEKLEMLENLLEIEVAFRLLRGGDRDSETDPLDQHYAKLNCGITPLDEESEEFQLISQYMTNTHAATHADYKLKLLDVFRVERSGEADRFKEFRQLHNHQLLWHGSRVSNYAGILSQGLRIAPPEAPVTGYMFGKGVYFADMVSKSANYCFTDTKNTTGLLLLSEVALGNSQELKAAKTITRLPPDYHSVKGCGQTEPDPKQSLIGKDGVKVPLGKPTQVAGSHGYSLLYNEYIVYKEAQVNLKYLLKVRFDYKR